MGNYTLADGLINGVGGTLGGGVFLLIGELIKDNQGNAYLAFVGGAIICMIVAFCYCILSKEYPGKGGTAEYPKKVFKNKKLQLFLTGLIIFGYTSLFCVYSLSAGNYLGDYMEHPEVRKIIAVGVIGMCMLVSFMPPKLFKRLQTGFVTSKLLVLFGIIFGGVYRSYVPVGPIGLDGLAGLDGLDGLAGPIDHSVVSPLIDNVMKSVDAIKDPTLMTGGTVGSLGSIASLGSLGSLASLGPIADKLKALTSSLSVFVTYEGFEMNSIYSAGMKNPNINMPNAYFLTILISAVVYIGLTVVTNKFIGTTINEKNSSSSLIDLVKVLGFASSGPIIVVIANMIANVSANIATIGSLESITEEYIKDASLENTIFNKKIKLFNNSKSVALLLTGVISMIAILYGPEKVVVNSGSLSFLLIFTIVCFMTYLTIVKKQKKKEPITIYNKKINHWVCKAISILGIVLCSSGFGKLVHDISVNA